MDAATRGENSLIPKLILIAAILLAGMRAWPQDSLLVSHRGPVIAPREIHTPEPEYSEAGRKAKQQGTVLLSVIVDSNGNTRDVKVLVPLGYGLDEKAVEALGQWKFAPATKDGKSVAVQIQVAIRFTLYTASIGQVELASDTHGVDFTAYLDSVIQKVNNEWAHQVVSTNKTDVTLQFAIQKDGHAAHIQTISSSGDKSFDRAARECIAASNPLQPLPPAFKSKEAILRMQFLSNSAGLTISPNYASVSPGASMQFSIALDTNQNPAVNWSVSGEGCTGSACGTISADGLYQAPEVSSGLLYVSVKAALRGNPAMNTASLVTVPGH